MSTNGNSNYPDIFQQKMNYSFIGYVIIRSYRDELSIITKVDCTDRVQKLELSLNTLKEKRLKCNIQIYFFR